MIDPKVWKFTHLGLKLFPRLITMPYFSWHWDQSQLHHIQDFGTDPNAFFSMKLGSIPTTACTGLWDWSQCLVFHDIGINPNYCMYMTLGLIPKSHFGQLGMIPMWHLDCAISRGLIKKCTSHHHQKRFCLKMFNIWIYLTGLFPKFSIKIMKKSLVIILKVF